MHGRRERIRRALSVVVLACASVVLVATSQQSETSGDTFESGPLSFDSRTEAVEGTVGPTGGVPPQWRSRDVVVRAESARSDAVLLVEVLDGAGTVVASGVRRGAADASSGASCDDGGCFDDVRYRIQSLDDEEVTIEVEVSISFDSHDHEDLPDVPVDAPAPAVVTRSGFDRPAVLASTTLEVDPTDPVDAARVSWRSRTCTDQKSVQMTALRVQSSAGTSDWRLQTLGRAADKVPNWEWSTVRSVRPSCEQVDPGEAHNTVWAVLSTDGEVVDYELAVLGPDAHPTVHIDRATAESTPVERVRGDGVHRVVHQARPTGAAASPSPVYLLAMEFPVPSGVAARYFRGGAPALASVGSGSCGRCAHLALSIQLRPDDPGNPSDPLEVQTVAYEISVP